MNRTAKQIKGITISLVRGDITREDVDAIVNAANSGLMGGGGVDGAIHRAAGPQVLEECKRIRDAQGKCPSGHAVITGGGKLKARYIIHAVGPIWHGGNSNEEETLASAYRESLRRAQENEVTSVAFPSISTGAYGFPVDRAALIAVKTAVEFCDDPGSVKEIRYVLFDDRTYQAFEKALNSVN
ncbi:MAG TPA: O-acetyl-ADP-ribose deacetylase [Candidatus Obscuribacterales bacterium]